MAFVASWLVLRRADLNAFCTACDACSCGGVLTAATAYPNHFRLAVSNEVQFGHGPELPEQIVVGQPEHVHHFPTFKRVITELHQIRHELCFVDEDDVVVTDVDAAQLGYRAARCFLATM